MTERSSSIISRRQFLFGSGAIAVLTSAYTGFRHLGEYPDCPLPLTQLSNKEVALYRILGDWLIPPGGALPGQGGDDTCILRIDDMFRYVPPGKRDLLSALPLAFEHGTLLHRLGAQCLSQMPTPEAHLYLDAWARSQNLIRCQLMAALKAIYSFAYFEQDEVLLAMNLPPLCLVPS